MCGLFGYCAAGGGRPWQKTFELVESLFKLTAINRGTDACGFVAINSNDKIVWDKKPIDAEHFTKTSSQWQSIKKRPAKMIMGHVRFATHGSPKKQINNHPFVDENQTIFVMHNGVIENYQQLAGREGLTLRSECDSEILLRLAELYDNLMDDPSSGVRYALDYCVGSLAMTLFDYRREMIILARNERQTLWIARFPDGSYLWSSERGLIVSALVERFFADSPYPDPVMMIPMAANHVHFLSMDGHFNALSQD